MPGFKSIVSVGALALLAASAHAQAGSPLAALDQYLNPALSAECKTSMMEKITPVGVSCGVIELASIKAPQEQLDFLMDQKFLTTLCNDQCGKAMEGLSTTLAGAACGDTRLINPALFANGTAGTGNPIMTVLAALNGKDVGSALPYVRSVACTKWEDDKTFCLANRYAAAKKANKVDVAAIGDQEIFCDGCTQKLVDSAAKTETLTATLKPIADQYVGLIGESLKQCPADKLKTAAGIENGASSSRVSMGVAAVAVAAAAMAL
ncbi:hypothetical protein HDU85_006454 [Gaertneriomyces sp. JEL0708]|nr:hypothetical protein HDU85_006454 [Gaertneriomyces sp. JEL0708]